MLTSSERERKRERMEARWARGGGGRSDSKVKTLKMKVADGMESATNTAENQPGTKAGRQPWKAHLHSTEWPWQTVLCLPALPPLPLHLATSQLSSGDHPPHRSSWASMKLIHP